MLFWYIINTLTAIFTVYAVLYAICLRRFNWHQYISHQELNIRRKLLELADYLESTVEVLILQGATNDDPNIVGFQRIHSLLETVHRIPLEEIETNINAIEKIIFQEDLCPGIRDKVEKEISVFFTLYKQIRTSRQYIPVYEFIIHKFFRPLKRMFFLICD